MLKPLIRCKTKGYIIHYKQTIKVLILDLIFPIEISNLKTFRT